MGLLIGQLMNSNRPNECRQEPHYPEPSSPTQALESTLADEKLFIEMGRVMRKGRGRHDT